MVNGKLWAAVLAAGSSTRIKSRRSKLLHRLSGKEVIKYPVEALQGLAEEIFVVVGGPFEEEVRAALSGYGVKFVRQPEPKGTGHAVAQLEGLLGEGHLLVLPGDAPLWRAETLRDFVEFHALKGGHATVMFAELPDPSGYGRVVRDGEKFVRIVEHHEAAPEELEIREICAGVYVFRVPELFEHLKRVPPSPKTGEFYLPKVLEIMQEARLPIYTYQVKDWREVLGVNTRKDMRLAQRVITERLVSFWEDRGVFFFDPGSVYLEWTVELARDVTVYPGVALFGETKVGEGATLLPGAVLVDSEVKPETLVKPGHYFKEVLE